jgi:hypothetical protein
MCSGLLVLRSAALEKPASAFLGHALRLSAALFFLRSYGPL